MDTARYRTMALVYICAVALVSAQITFSRDWTGGKRAAPQLALDCDQFTRLCHHFVHELKKALTSEMAGRRHREDPDRPLLYDDE